jgi:hypothetical protein
MDYNYSSLNGFNRFTANRLGTFAIYYSSLGTFAIYYS